MSKCRFAQSWLDLMQVIAATVSSIMPQFSTSSPSHGSSTLSAPCVLPQLLEFSEPWRRYYGCPIMVRHSCSLLFSVSWPVMSLIVTADHCKQKHLHPKLTTALLFGINSYLKGNVTGTSCPFSKLTSVASVLEPMTSPAMGLWSSLQKQT